MRTIIFAFFCIAIFSGCRIKISSSERRGAKKINDKSSPRSFNNILASGKILDETSFENYRLLLVKPVNSLDGTQYCLFLEEFIPKKNTDDSNYRRKINVWRLSLATKPFQFDISSDKLGQLPLSKICAFVNGNHVTTDIFFEVAGFDSSVTETSKAFFKGIYIQRVPCTSSEIMKINTGLSSLPLKNGYVNAAINCLPNSCGRCSLVDSVKNGNPIYWKEKTPQTDTAKKTNVAAKEVADDFDFNFPYKCPCADSDAFTIYLKYGKNGKIAIENKMNITKIKGATVTIPISQKDTTVKIEPFGSAVIKSDTTIIFTALVKNATNASKPQAKAGPATEIHVGGASKKTDIDTIKTADSIHITFSAPSLIEYPFNYGFEPINYYSIDTWLKNSGLKMDCDCANQMAFMITQQIMLNDSAYINCKFCKNTAVAAAKDADTKDNAVKKTPVKPGTVKIITTPATVLEPVYSSKIQKTPFVIPLQLQLIGPYDSTASQVSFVMQDQTLSDSLGIYDTTLTIAKQDWNDALANDGVYNVNLLVKTISLKDTISKTEEGYIVLSGLPASIYGAHEVQLIPSFANPNKHFWVEVGSNFDMINGLQPNNLYAGIFMYKKDVMKLSRYDKQPNLGLIAGVYESRSSSSDLSSDTGLVYRDGRSYIPSTGGTYAIFRDTGSVSIKTNIYSVGLFFSPQLRLTNGAAETNGLHIFASFWAELLWQKTQQQYDYSKLDSLPGTFQRVSTIDSVNSFRSKQTAITTTDFRSHYYGLGLPLYLKLPQAYFYLNPVFGFTTQRFAIADDSSVNTNKNSLPGLVTGIRRGWNPFYLVQFRLNDEQYGLSVTGEIRGIILPNTKPSVSLALSKKFDLNALAKLIVSPF